MKNKWLMSFTITFMTFSVVRSVPTFFVATSTIPALDAADAGFFSVFHPTIVTIIKKIR